jgi:hypothetical protein
MRWVILQIKDHGQQRQRHLIIQIVDNGVKNLFDVDHLVELKHFSFFFELFLCIIFFVLVECCYY